MNEPVATLFDAGHRSRQELHAIGESLRERLPCQAHAAWTPDDRRPDPVDVLVAQEAGRIPELVPIRYGRMAESPFRFFRGAAALMAYDLAQLANTGINVQACGDAHVLNFGLYASPERHVVFDINDFDETLPAPWEFDLKRLVASVVLECRDAHFGDHKAGDAVRATMNGYCRVMNEFSVASSLDIHYAIMDEHRFFDTEHDKSVAKYARKALRKARKRTRQQAFKKWCTDIGGQLRFVDDPPLLVRLGDEEAAQFHRLFNRYRDTLQTDREHALRQYRFRDVARRVVGVGSVGLGAYVLLLEGRGDADPLIIQVKEATSSVLTPYLGKSGYERHGQRVVVGQRLMQAASDPFLGWAPFAEKDFYLRQLRDMKGKTDTPGDWETYTTSVAIAGGTLARAHARSVDPGLVSAYLGGGESITLAMIEFAFAYADQTERDYERMQSAIRAGEIAAERGI